MATGHRINLMAQPVYVPALHLEPRIVRAGVVIAPVVKVAIAKDVAAKPKRIYARTLKGKPKYEPKTGTSAYRVLGYLKRFGPNGSGAITEGISIQKHLFPPLAKTLVKHGYITRTGASGYYTYAAVKR